MQIEKPVMPLCSNFNWIFHYSFQEQIIETKNEINIPWMNSLVREWSKHMNGFDCNTWLIFKLIMLYIFALPIVLFLNWWHFHSQNLFHLHFKCKISNIHKTVIIQHLPINYVKWRGTWKKALSNNWLTTGFSFQIALYLLVKERRIQHYIKCHYRT